MNRTTLELIRKEFAARLQAKTNWGRNELLAEYNIAVANVLASLIDESESK